MASVASVALVISGVITTSSCDVLATVVGVAEVVVVVGVDVVVEVDVVDDAAAVFVEVELLSSSSVNTCFVAGSTIARAFLSRFLI